MLRYSIHDIDQSNFKRLKELARLMHSYGIYDFQVLLIAGSKFSKDQLQFLKSLQASGAQMVGHGIDHLYTGRKNLKYYLCYPIANKCSENLRYRPNDVAAKIDLCYNLLANQGLKPSYYIAPGWVLNARASKVLRKQSSFRFIETFFYLHDKQTNQRKFQFSARFRARTYISKYLLRCWNWSNLILALILKQEIRINIHPNDLQLFLKEDLFSYLGFFGLKSQAMLITKFSQ